MVKRFCCIILLLLPSGIVAAQQSSNEPNPKIQIALLLDISGSMEGLIIQTRSQFWNIINYMNSASVNGQKPLIEFALITYGGAEHEKNGYINVMTNLTSELDSVAKQFHNLDIGGSNEYCWRTVATALDSLSWSEEKADLRLIIIAGNEPFSVAGADKKKVVKQSRKKEILINTVYCGKKEDPFYKEWVEASKLGRGKSSTIDINDTTVTKESGMDFKMSEFNEKLNSTYIPYGKNGQKGLDRLNQEDDYARMSGIPFLRDRIAYKATDSFQNQTWDLVDAFQNDSTVLERLLPDEFPEHMKVMDVKQKTEHLTDTRSSRENYKTVITLRYQRILNHLDGVKEETINKSIRDILDQEGKKKGFVFKEVQPVQN